MLSIVQRRVRTLRPFFALSRASFCVRKYGSLDGSRPATFIVLRAFEIFDRSFTERNQFLVSMNLKPLSAAKGMMDFQQNKGSCYSSCIQHRTVGRFASVRAFHTSRPKYAGPILGAILASLKSSTILGVLNTLFRVALTFLPATFIKLQFSTAQMIKRGANSKYTRELHIMRWLFRLLFIIPTSLLVATLIASLERTPLTGRWRIILLSPAEEEEIIETLKRTWRSAIDAVLTSTSDSDLPPPALPTSDWRHRWVESTLRRLENVVPLLQIDPTSKIHFSLYDGDFPFPPPSVYPLVARPRAAQIAHDWMSPKKVGLDEMDEDKVHMEGDNEDPTLNLIGPPYSCLVVNHESQNAFSYGFGPGSAGGIVVYTGFLDEVLQDTTSHQMLATTAPSPNSLLSLLFGSLLSVSKRNYDYQPTEKQTSELAVLLAHELAHLLLAHHLETLSSTSILLPSVTSILTDIARAVFFPCTMLFGPFVNDALFQLGKHKLGEVNELSAMSTERELEIEADLVSARLLAHAGFDPREAIKFWETRMDKTKSISENPKAVVGCIMQGGTNKSDWATTTASWAMGREIHPLKEERVKALKKELERWEIEWNKLSL